MEFDEQVGVICTGLDLTSQIRTHTDSVMQVVATLAVIAYSVMAIAGVSGPASIVLGGGLALSSTAVAMQVLQDRGETGSRFGRATFAVLLLQVRCLRGYSSP